MNIREKYYLNTVLLFLLPILTGVAAAVFRFPSGIMPIVFLGAALVLLVWRWSLKCPCCGHPIRKVAHLNLKKTVFLPKACEECGCHWE